MFCLAPLILAGQLFTVTVPGHVSDLNGQYVEVQTCERGVGLHAKAATNGLFAFGLHYGFKIVDADKFSITFQPKAGLSYTTVERPELPLQGQFEVGAGLVFGYDQFRVGVEYWHLSNAGLEQPNIGVDMIGITTGWRF